MNLKSIIIAILMVFTFGFAKAQYYGAGAAGGGRTLCAVQSGDVKSIADVKTFNVIYDYSKMGVGAFVSEEDYLKKKSEEYDKKEPGKGDKFKAGWVNARKERYEPKFLLLMNKGLAKRAMVGTNYSTDKEVTLTVVTKFTEPGFNMVMAKQPSSVDIELIFADKAGKELVRYFVKNSVGANASGFDYDAGSRIVESYAKAAKMCAKQILKDLKKAGVK